MTLDVNIFPRVETSWSFFGRLPRHNQYRNLVALEMLISPQHLRVHPKKDERGGSSWLAASDTQAHSLYMQCGQASIQTEVGVYRRQNFAELQTHP